MYNTTEAVKAALGQSVVRMRLLSESVSLLASDAKPIQSSDGKPIWVFVVGPFPDGKVDGEQLSSLSYSAGCCDGDIGIGSVSAASLSGSIHGVINLLGVTFTAQVGVDVEGVTQWLNLGKFTVTECSRTDDSTTFTAYDAAYTALGAVYTPTVQSGATASAVLADVANQAGVDVEPTTLILCTMAVTGDLTGHTCREMVGYIAALCGKNALITRDGFLRFVFVEPTEQSVTADDYYAGAMSNGGISKLWGLSCTVPGQEEEQTLTVGNAEKAVTVSCPYMTQAQLERVWYDIGGYEYPVGNVSFYRGLLTEPGDLVSLTNLAGNTITLPAMQVNLEIDGGCRCTISSFGKSEAVRISGTSGPMEKRLQRVARTASAALLSANGKNKNFYQANAPTAADGLTPGDLWFDTANGNRISEWTGSAWTLRQFGALAVTNLDAGSITAGTINAARIGAHSITADKIDVADLFAQNITATGSITGAALSVGTQGAQTANTGYFNVNSHGRMTAENAGIKNLDLTGKTKWLATAGNWFRVYGGSDTLTLDYDMHDPGTMTETIAQVSFANAVGGTQIESTLYGSLNVSGNLSCTTLMGAVKGLWSGTVVVNPGGNDTVDVLSASDAQRILDYTPDAGNTVVLLSNGDLGAAHLGSVSGAVDDSHAIIAELGNAINGLVRINYLIVRIS